MATSPAKSPYQHTRPAVPDHVFDDLLLLVRARVADKTVNYKDMFAALEFRHPHSTVQRYVNRYLGSTTSWCNKNVGVVKVRVGKIDCTGIRTKEGKVLLKQTDAQDVVNIAVDKHKTMTSCFNVLLSKFHISRLQIRRSYLLKRQLERQYRLRMLKAGMKVKLEEEIKRKQSKPNKPYIFEGKTKMDELDKRGYKVTDDAIFLPDSLDRSTHYCALCDKYFTDSQKIYVHCLEDTRHKLTVLDLCPKLKLHLPGYKCLPTKCDLCKVAIRFSEIKPHVNSFSHFKRRQFLPSLCELCYRRFFNSFALKKHIQTDHGMTPEDYRNAQIKQVSDYRTNKFKEWGVAQYEPCTSQANNPEIIVQREHTYRLPQLEPIDVEMDQPCTSKGVRYGKPKQFNKDNAFQNLLQVVKMYGGGPNVQNEEEEVETTDNDGDDNADDDLDRPESSGSSLDNLVRPGISQSVEVKEEPEKEADFEEWVNLQMDEVDDVKPEIAELSAMTSEDTVESSAQQSVQQTVSTVALESSDSTATSSHPAASMDSSIECLGDFKGKPSCLCENIDVDDLEKLLELRNKLDERIAKLME